PLASLVRFCSVIPVLRVCVLPDCVSFFLVVFLLVLLPPPRSTLFPYTTLFRSVFDRAGRVLRNLAPRGKYEALLLSRDGKRVARSEEHTSELQSHLNLVCRLLLEKKKIH